MANELLAMLAQKPHQTLAFLPDHASVETIAETLAAFANRDGGVLLVGVLPSGIVSGLSDPDAAEARVLSAFLQVDPPFTGGMVMPGILEHEGHSLIQVEVPRGLSHVYRVGPRFVEREGATNRDMGIQRLRELIMTRGDPFERRAPEGAETRDLSRTAIEQYLLRLPGYDPVAAGAAQRTSDLLRRQGILRPDDGRPTYAGLLLFGRQPQQWLPSAQLLFARYPGTEMGDRFERQQIDGPLPQQILRAETFVLDSMRRGVVMRGLQREERLEYPREAVREAIVNAVAHRDYTVRGAEIQIFMFANRIEFHSPGRLPGHVTLNNILHERFSRNETLVQVLSDLGYIERLGYGIDRILRLAAEHGLPEPQLAESANGFRLTLFGPGDTFADTIQSVQGAGASPPPARQDDPLARWRALGLNPRQLDALAFIEQDGRITNRDFQELAPDVSPETLRRDLADLVDRGIILKIGERKGTYYILK